MKCQKCGANNANTHVKTVINGEIKEYDLCSECAKKMGYTNIFGNFEDEFSGRPRKFLRQQPSRKNSGNTL